jgi:CheY-like chemotaxis protein
MATLATNTGLLKFNLNEVVIMEDDKVRRSAVSKILKNKGCKVYEVDDIAQAIKIANERHPQAYILDINMGEQKEQYGLDALERLKKLDEGLFVSIYSMYPDQYKAYSRRLHADHFQEKTSDTLSDINKILHNFLIAEHKKIGLYIKMLEQETNIPSDTDNIKGQPAVSDSNYACYKQLLANRSWRQDNIGRYVAIVNCVVVGVDTNEETLLSKVRNEYPTESCYFTLVEETETVIDLPSTLEYIEINQLEE